MTALDFSHRTGPEREVARLAAQAAQEDPMTEVVTKPRAKARRKTQRPRLYKVILLNDDYTPREFVVSVLKAVFRMNEDQAYRVMMTAHRRGVCVVAVFTKDVAETKATLASEAGRSKGYPLSFTTEPEE
jgi:ATP-dependent Clp protease adaptor protein ClpS